MSSGKIKPLADAPARGDQERMLKMLLAQLDAMVYRCRDDEFWTMEFVSDGSIIWISENARAVRGTDGAIRYFEGTVEDITERKTQERRIAHQATQAKR